MLRLSILGLLAVSAFAQDAVEALNKPPEDVDKALRARIMEFYQYHIDKTFRKAEPLVAEDTKEFFYVQNKPHYMSCEINRIDYFENFTHAKAVMVCLMMVPMPGFTDPVKVPFPSLWKIEDGKWCWYVDPEAYRTSPMGRMSGGPPSAGAPAVAMPGDDASTHESGGFLFSLLKFETQLVRVTHGGKTERVTIRSIAPGLIDLALSGSVPGIEAKLEKTQLKGEEETHLILRPTEDAKAGASGTLNIKIVQLNQIFKVNVEVM